MICENCINFYQAKGFKKDKCPGINYVDECSGLEGNPERVHKLSNENRLVFIFFQKIAIYVFSGMGGYNMQPIIEAFDIYNVPQNQREMLMDRITVLLTAYGQAKSEEKGQT